MGKEGEIMKKSSYFRYLIGLSIFSFVAGTIILAIERYKERSKESTSTPECLELNESTYALNDPATMSGLFILLFSLCKK